MQNDHVNIYQYNVIMTDEINPHIMRPFQEEDKIYWLVIGAVLDDSSPQGAEWGWKTSGSDQFADDAVYYDSYVFYVVNDIEYMIPNYLELHDPLDQEKSLDMAFVIVPEPATLSLLALGGLALLKRRRS